MQHKSLNLECTINLHKKLYKVDFKKRAARALFEVKKFVKQLLNVKQIKVDSNLNKKIWKKGRRYAPFKIRVRIVKKTEHVTRTTSGVPFVFIYEVK
ncbi:60S ribosomal protein L31 (nucleomorph) [Cryptomonas paramecium]|uniref:60S ribosomal protein L31 n=1 Tax=Cryptomonas paramaecium TaxID=2898 RepID=F2HHU3_9CRYP|nr:60S ribosomal protein L31 [Cryptomonas paramecium]AEA38889.1 60S ribosomal protein L31 [Cryptomonas paramecium]|mmetsp:Transcript_88799/g.236394  ORF Transcript_88799/g.236394 Transcript_88799/m.236394 type:complete len:97 (-) Transcript_88799:2573-2863(-)